MEMLYKVGNLKIYCEILNAFELNIIAINGTDEVARESFSGFRVSPTKCAERLLNNRFDIYTLSDIRAALPEIVSEFDGALLSGKIAGFDSLEYFKRIDDTQFYKHFTRRPMMPKED